MNLLHKWRIFWKSDAIAETKFSKYFPMVSIMQLYPVIEAHFPTIYSNKQETNYNDKITNQWLAHNLDLFQPLGNVSPNIFSKLIQSNLIIKNLI